MKVKLFNQIIQELEDAKQARDELKSGEGYQFHRGYTAALERVLYLNEIFKDEKDES